MNRLLALLVGSVALGALLVSGSARSQAPAAASPAAAAPPGAAPAAAAPAAPVAAAPASATPGPAEAFVDVARVLQSPRCVNCHPSGNAPIIGDDARPHGMGVSRNVDRIGMSCQTCHLPTAVDPVEGPPAAPHWHMPPAAAPMVFQALTPRALCEQMKDPARNGGKTLPALVEHVRGDALVLYGWNPGGGRTLPPLTHADFVSRFETWAAAGGPCP